MSNKLFTLSALAAFLASPSNAALPDGSLESCKKVANMFDNTCNDEGETVTCTGTMRCPGSSNGEQTYTASNPCKWTRKLCVECY